MRNHVKLGWSSTHEQWCIMFNNIVEEFHELKQDAEKAGREMAKDNKPSRFTVQRKDGGISYEQIYGGA